MEKKRIAVIVGGRSSEHEISLVSAATVIDHIDRETFDILIIGITRDGLWRQIDSVDDLRDGRWVEEGFPVVPVPDTGSKTFLVFSGDIPERVLVDVVFPVLHGMNGEDGTIQGLFELMQIPYVGCGVIASACAMDKFFTKVLVDSTGIRQAKYLGIYRRELKDMERVIDRIEDTFTYPVFVKPSKAGSSKGVSCAGDRESLKCALIEAADHDSKILVEERITGREIECAVLGGYGDVRASGVGEILAADSFYSYEAKYNNEDSQTVVNPDIPSENAEEIREDAVKIFKTLDGYGLARVDFFLTEDSGEVVFNEINTLPGFTAISMYPMLWEDRGIDKKALISQLIDLALARYED